jgi:hypothetical protein
MGEDQGNVVTDCSQLNYVIGIHPTTHFAGQWIGPTPCCLAIFRMIGFSSQFNQRQELFHDID